MRSIILSLTVPSCCCCSAAPVPKAARHQLLFETHFAGVSVCHAVTKVTRPGTNEEFYFASWMTREQIVEWLDAYDRGPRDPMHRIK